MDDTAAERSQVIVVGGGPVGMGLAITLGLRGIACTVIERYPQPQPIPKGQNLTQRTMEHFHFWGIETELRAARTIPPEYGIGGLTAYGTLFGAYQHDWLQRALVQRFYYTANERLPQYATEAVLRARAAEIPAITTRYGWRAQAAGQDENGAWVEATDAQGASRRFQADYVVGCDGSNSLVRGAAGIIQTRADHDRLMVLLVFRSKGLHALLERFPGKSFYNVLHPDFGGYWQFFGRVDLGESFFFHAPVPLGTTRDNFDFKAFLHKAAGADFDVEIEHVGFWDLRFAVADTYRSGRFFVAGDAAHSHPPYGGYGINTGFEDAVNLGWKLAAVLNGLAPQPLLDTYSEERQPVFASTARDFIAKSITVDREFLEGHDPTKDLPAFEAAWKARSGDAQSEVNAFEPNYEGSSAVWSDTAAKPSAVGQHALAARAGHHLAPVMLSNGRNIFELLGQNFNLLCLDADAGQVDAFRQAAEELGVPLDIVEDSRGDERAAYGTDLVLIRPDQFVAWTGHGAGEAPAAVLAKVVRAD